MNVDKVLEGPKRRVTLTITEGEQHALFAALSGVVQATSGEERKVWQGLLRQVRDCWESGEPIS